MKLESDVNEKAGSYLGTEIDEKWWRRYTKDKMLARGSGGYWYDDESFFFLRHLTKEPLSIALKNIIECKVGTWHAGKWGGGNPILKIIWSKNGQRLSSGFVISKKREEVERLVGELTSKR